jgi:hypothetical protein
MLIADGRPSKDSSDPQCLYSAKQAAPSAWNITCSINQLCDLTTMTICSIFLWKLKKMGKFGVNLQSATGFLLFCDAIIRFWYYDFALFFSYVLDDLVYHISYHRHYIKRLLIYDVM